MIDLIKIFDYAKQDLWRDIKGYEDLYQVSHTGKVRSLNYHRTGKIQELKPGIYKGYYFVILCKENVKHKKRVSRLVAEAFMSNTENKPCVDHIDTNRINNHVNNLKWSTSQENSNNEITKCNMCLSKLGKNGKKIYLYDINKKLILKLNTKGQSAFYLSKFSNYKINTLEHLLNINHKNTIVNTGKLFADKFYIYDYKLEEVK